MRGWKKATKSISNEIFLKAIKTQLMVATEKEREMRWRFNGYKTQKQAFDKKKKKLEVGKERA